MRARAISGQSLAPGTWRRDFAVSVLLTVILSIGWGANGWSDLSRLLLPDADDMMRLAQVRDWLAGQGINDWTQYRMAPPSGAPMHWSRVNDVGLAALILGFSPLVGRAGAELIAVLAYPALLFVTHLMLVARIAHRLWGPAAGMVAIVLGGLAYPGTTVFVPGRIDHHALQVVLIEIAVVAAMCRGTWRAGAVTGGAIALSLVVGLETAPQVAGLLAACCLIWVMHGESERVRLGGLALGLGGATLPFLVLLRPTLWSRAYCDAFTPATAYATMLVAATLGVLALATRWLFDWRIRLGMGGLAALAISAFVAKMYPVCLTGPYGQVDLFLRREFIVHIDEANGIFAQELVGRTVQFGGLMLASTIAIGWIAWSRPSAWATWLPIAPIVAVSAGISLLQVRGTYVGGPLGAPLLAGVILATRANGRVPLLLLAWLGCSGVGWYIAPPLAERVIAATRGEPAAIAVESPLRLCNTADAWASLDRYPPGIVMAPTSVAAFMIGATRMSAIGAGYHRNNRGNMAMYRYFLSPPEQAAAIAHAWQVRYVAFCPGDFREMDGPRRFPRSLAAMLDAGRAPANFEPLRLQGTRLRFYRLR